jgi:hypothetical protein
LAKRGGSRLLRKEAVAIAKKIGSIETGAKHDRAVVRLGGRVIAHFGIRRGNAVPHGFIPHQIYVSERQALELANCTMSKDQYVELMRHKGHLDEPLN